MIRAAAAKGRTWTTWRYFVTAIREQNDVGKPAAVATPAPPLDQATHLSGERAMVRRWKETPGSWPYKMGPKPGEPGCRISAEVLAEFDIATPAARPAITRSGEPAIDFGGGYVWPVSTVKDAIKRWRKDPSSWPHVIGPPPGESGCRVPLDIYDPAKARAGLFILARAFFRGEWEDGWEQPKPGQRGFPDDIAAEVAREFNVSWPPPPGWPPGPR